MVTNPVRSPEKSSVNQTHSYTYDADGNETSYSSGNVSVHYNLLSLPDSVESSIFAGRIRMAYMADGRRMLTQTQTSQTQLLLPMTATAASTQSSNPRYTTTEVRDGDLVFRDGRLVRLYTEGGYYSLWNDTLQSAWVRPYAYVQDQLGSVRLVIDATSRDTVQSLEYLPTGKIWRSAHAAFQPNKFCGKEALTQNAWDVYDSLARFQRMSYPRFTSPDPLAEKYYGVSPYAYAGNDFVNIVDPTGRDLILTGDDAQKAYALLQEKFKNQLSITIDDAGKIGYQVLEGAKQNSIAKLLSKIVDDHRIMVNLYCFGKTSTFDGGAFMGSIYLFDRETREAHVNARQFVEVPFIESLDNTIKSPGKNLMHEISEAYEGALIALASKKNVLPAIKTDDGKTNNNDYLDAHRRATRQTRILYYEQDGYRYFLIESNQKLFYEKPIF